MKAILFIFIMILSSASLAEDFDKVQNNFRIRNDSYGIEVREEFNSEKDHLQLMYYGIKGYEFRYRYVDNKEHRLMASIISLDTGNFYFRPRLDYRAYINKDDVVSFRSSFGLYKRIEDIRVWTEINPIWNFGNNIQNDSTMDSAQIRVGFDYFQTKQFSYGSFVQYEIDKHFDKTDVFLGTMIVYNVM